MSTELGKWHLGPAMGGPNIWQDGDVLLIAVLTSKGWEFDKVFINADETASMETEDGDSYTSWDFADISYWMHHRDMSSMLPQPPTP